MDIQISRLDMKKTAERWPRDLPFAPALLVKQPTVAPSPWIVIDAPIVAGQALSTAFAHSDQYVRVPLFPYQLSPQADVAFAQVIELAMACVGQFIRPVKKLHIVTGSPVDLFYDDDITTATGLRYWFGLAFVLE
jgi:hypothetical protein